MIMRIRIIIVLGSAAARRFCAVVVLRLHWDGCPL